MANYNPKTKEIEFSYEDREMLSGQRKDKHRVRDLMNYIIWGDKKEFYEKDITNNTF